MFGIAPPGEVGILRFPGENAMRTKMDIIAPIFFVKNLAISGHEHGD
jgi:hypothetical protein